MKLKHGVRKKNRMNSQLLIVVLLMSTLMVRCTKKKEVAYHGNGNIKYTVPLNDGKRNGTLLKYYEDGKLYLKSNWVNGKKEGETISYFKNGQPNVIELYKNGELMDSIIIYDSIGNITEIVRVHSGKKNGLYRVFYPDKSLKVKGYYKDDKKDGKAIVYYPNGLIESRKIFNNDSLIYFVNYDESGRLKQAYLPISVDVNDSLEFYSIDIKLKHNFFDEGYIGVAIGKLDENYALVDTTAIFDSKRGSHEVNYKIDKAFIDDEKIEGLVFEIDSTNTIQSKFPINFNLKELTF
jgi:antitoxin component YwqK of YwqJK toxin-antitoxin module